MRRCYWSRMVGIGLLVELVGSLPASAWSRTVVPVSVHMLDRMALPPGVLDEARGEVWRIFDAIGVDLIWTPDTCVVESEFIVQIVPEQTARRITRSLSALGLTPRTKRATAGKVAYVFYDRVQAAASTRRVAIERVLGAVIAHELGHLLMPPGADASAGLMGGVWSDVEFRNAAAGILRFRPEEGERIRRHLAGRASGKRCPRPS